MGQKVFDPNTLDSNGVSLLESLVSRGSVYIVRTLLQRGDVNVNINTSAPLKKAEETLANCKLKAMSDCQKEKEMISALKIFGAKI